MKIAALISQVPVPAGPKNPPVSEDAIKRFSEDGGTVKNPILGDLGELSGVEFFQKLLPALVGMGFVIGSLVFVFVMILGAIQWISSGGDKAAVDAAKGKITNALIGLVVLFSIVAIIKLLEDFFGINILTIDIGPLKIQ